MRRWIRMSGLTVNDDLTTAVQSTNMRAEIQRTWRRFSAQEVEALIDNQDLVCKLSKKYRLDHFQAKQIVEDFARGRHL